MLNLEEITAEKIIICDGANGTLLHQRLPKGSQIDLAILEFPDEVTKVHLDYINAGAMIIQTHTFGTSRTKLILKNLEKKFDEINSKAVKIARDSRDLSGKTVLIAGSIGPSFRVSDELTLANCSIFSDQALILEERGCDLFMLESFPTIEELACAVYSIREISNLPIVAQITASDEWSPVPGGSRDYKLKGLLDLPAMFVGINCGAGPDEYLEILEEWGNVGEHLISVQPNAGVPVQKDGRYIFPSTTPEYFAYFAGVAVNSGVKLLGGCCGTTPEHIKAMAEIVKGFQPKASSRKINVIKPFKHEEEKVKSKSEFLTALHSEKFTNVVQLDPPKGTNIEDMLKLARKIKAHPDIAAVDINSNPLGRLHFDSLWLSGVIERDVGLETIPHITPRDASLMGLQSQLLGAWYSGVKNLLVITGDPSQRGDYPGATDVYQTDSLGLVKSIEKLNRAKDSGGSRIGNPPSFVVGVAINVGAEDREREIRKFKEKIDAGAQFAMTQIFFTWDIWDSFWNDYGSEPEIPVLAGIWPLTSVRLAKRIHNEIPGISIPDFIFKRLDDAGSEARKAGWEIAREFLKETSSYMRGAYLIAPYKRSETILDLLED